MFSIFFPNVEIVFSELNNFNDFYGQGHFDVKFPSLLARATLRFRVHSKVIQENSINRKHSYQVRCKVPNVI
jgi:hypothetical protein